MKLKNFTVAAYLMAFSTPVFSMGMPNLGGAYAQEAMRDLNIVMPNIAHIFAEDRPQGKVWGVNFQRSRINIAQVDLSERQSPAPDYRADVTDVTLDTNNLHHLDLEFLQNSASYLHRDGYGHITVNVRNNPIQTLNLPETLQGYRKMLLNISLDTSVFEENFSTLRSIFTSPVISGFSISIAGEVTSFMRDFGIGLNTVIQKNMHGNISTVGYEGTHENAQDFVQILQSRIFGTPKKSARSAQ